MSTTIIAHLELENGPESAEYAGEVDLQQDYDFYALLANIRNPDETEYVAKELGNRDFRTFDHAEQFDLDQALKANIRVPVTDYYKRSQTEYSKYGIAAPLSPPVSAECENQQLPGHYDICSLEELEETQRRYIMIVGRVDEYLAGAIARMRDLKAKNRKPRLVIWVSW